MPPFSLPPHPTNSQTPTHHPTKYTGLISVRIEINPLAPLGAIVAHDAVLASSLFAFFADALLVAAAFDAEEGDEAEGDKDEGASKDDADYGGDGDVVAEVAVRGAAFEELEAGC